MSIDGCARSVKTCYYTTQAKSIFIPSETDLSTNKCRKRGKIKLTDERREVFAAL